MNNSYISTFSSTGLISYSKGLLKLFGLWNVCNPGIAKLNLYLSYNGFYPSGLNNCKET